MIKESRNLKVFISRLLFGVYFIALLSQSFHHHDSVEYFKSFNLKKTENTITKATAKEKAGDCLACHFLVTGHTLAPEDFSLTFEHYSQEVKQIITIQEKIWSQTKFTFQLRGPPSFS